MFIEIKDLETQPVDFREEFSPGAIDLGPDYRQLSSLQTEGRADLVEEHYGKHKVVQDIRLKGKLDTMVEAVEREFGIAVEPWLPKGGIFLWMKLPDQVDVRKLVQPALKAGKVFISPYNDVDVMVGQGTIAVELEHQQPKLDAIFVAVGGGGLVGGIAWAAWLFIHRQQDTDL